MTRRSLLPRTCRDSPARRPPAARPPSPATPDTRSSSSRSLLRRNSSAAGRNHLWDRSPAPQLQPSDSCGPAGSAGWGGPGPGRLLRPRLRAEIAFSALLLSVPAASRVGALEEGESRRVLTGLSAWKGVAPLGKSRPGRPCSPGRPGRGRHGNTGSWRKPRAALPCPLLWGFIFNILPPYRSPRSHFRSVGSGCASPPLKPRGSASPRPGACRGAWSSPEGACVCKKPGPVR